MPIVWFSTGEKNYRSACSQVFTFLASLLDVKAFPLHSHKYSTSNSLKITLYLIWSHLTVVAVVSRIK